MTVLQEDGEELFEKHVEEWLKLYQQGGLEIEGNLQLVGIFITPSSFSLTTHKAFQSASTLS